MATNQPRLPTLVSTRKRLGLTLGASGIALAFLLAACTDDASPTNASEGVEGSESGGEGSGGESGESHSGSEGAGLGEAAEGGKTPTVLDIGDTFDEVQNGARLILSYDPGANAFVGSVENTTSGPLTRARVEVHLDNGTELGPTTPVDLAAGEVVDLTLPSTQASFQTWTTHPEVGSGEGGEGGEGQEGGSETGGEGPEGTEGGGEGPEGTEGGGSAAPGSTTHLTSTGISRGQHQSQALAASQAYAGKLNDLEVAVSFDAATDTFIGRVKNEANEGLCNTRLAIDLDGQRSAPEVIRIPALDLRGRADFELAAGPDSFADWTIETDTFTCTTVVSDGGEGGEGSGGEGGSEASGEGAGHESGSEGGSEGGAESGEEASPSTPVGQAATGTFNNLEFNVRYDTAESAFLGTVVNNTNQTVCGSRLEVHMAVGTQVIELGPTIGFDLAPGDSLDLLLSADPVIPGTYSLHPESSPCP